MSRCICVALLLTAFVGIDAASAAERHALVIGNSKYEGDAALRNPANDADAIEATLKKLDFRVTKAVDLDLDKLENAVVTFRKSLKKGSVAVFFYAGHGVQVKGENYLVPIDARLKEEFEVKRKCYAMNAVLEAMDSSESALKVVILDCCRDNPFTRGWTRGASGKGMASIADVPDGTIIAFATAAGKTAADGKGNNSPYTTHLIASLNSRPKEGLELTEALREASRAVKKETGQVPWLNLEASLDKFYLWRSGETPSAAPTVELKVHRDLAYAETKNDRQTLDVYTPREGRGRPIVFWIHGGGWQSGDKKEVDRKPQAFVDRGFVFVSINYRLLPEATIDQMAGDVAKAFRWVYDHAGEYGGDPHAIFVMGWSAGAQLAALVSTDDRYLKAVKLPLTAIKGCIPVDGDTFDVPLQIATVEERRATLYKKKFGRAEAQKNLSPVTHAAKGKSIPPFLVLHVADHPETKAQSQRLTKALREAGVSASTVSAAGKNHATINSELGAADDKPTKAVFEFLDRLLKPR